MYKTIHYNIVCDHGRLHDTLVNGGLCTMEDIQITEYYAAMQNSVVVLCTDIIRSLQYIAKCKRQGTDSKNANNASFYVIQRENKNL